MDTQLIVAALSKEIAALNICKLVLTKVAGKKPPQATKPRRTLTPQALRNMSLAQQRRRAKERAA
jgi:hypothetical protein